MSVIIKPQDSIAKHITVLVGGVDITYQCFKVDMQLGIAYCYCYDDRGNPIMDDPDTLATVEYCRGVEVKPAAGAPEWVSQELDKIREEAT